MNGASDVAISEEMTVMTNVTRRDFLKTVGATVFTIPIMGDVSTLTRETFTECGASGKRPNVILILCDDLGWGDLGIFWQNQRKGNNRPHIDTPHIDQAIREGVMLTNAYTTAPVCAPARASMVTGKNQGHCNLRDNRFDCPIDPHMTIATVMKAAGYDTWHLGKWGIGGGYQGVSPRKAMACDAGFDYSYGYPAHMHGHSYYHWEGNMDTIEGSPLIENVSATAYADGRYATLSTGKTTDDGKEMAFERDPTKGATYYRRIVSNDEVQFCYDVDLFTAKLKQLIDQQATSYSDKPFFAYTCYTTVHGSGNRKDPAIIETSQAHVPPSGIDYPALSKTDTTWGGGVTFEKKNGELAFKGTAKSANRYIHADYANYDSWGQKRYATMVRRLDDAIGDLRHFLKVRGLDENTLIIFTSDNGPAGENLSSSGITWVQNKGFDSNGPFKGMKRWSYEGGLREPTFAVWPGTIPVADGSSPRVSAHPFQFPAWMATLADVAGVPQPAHCDGVSILPTLTGKGMQLPARIYCEYVDGGSGQGFGLEQMVRDGDYVLIRNHGKNHGTVELYHVATDEGQTTDIAVTYPETVQKMTDLLYTCRMPSSKLGTDGFTSGGTARTKIDATALPATRQSIQSMEKWNVRFYNNSDTQPWPWVPNFRTMLPNREFRVTSMEELRTQLPETGAYGLAIRGWLEVSAEQYITFTALGAGGCQLWIHEAHALEWEADNCTTGKSITLKLAKGAHPFRLYLTTTDGIKGLCTLHWA